MLVRALTVAVEWRTHWHRDMIIGVCGFGCAPVFSTDGQRNSC
jgi:hypothetical protein